MAHDQKPDEQIVYVGDSRLRKRTKVYVPRDYSAYPGKSEAFIPNFLLKEWMVAVVVLVGILVLVMSEPAPLGLPADPTDTSFIPIPDWYFLFLFQLLKYPYAAGSVVLIGTVILPGVAFGALLLAPFLDTGPERRFYRRPIASTLMFLSLICVGYLTVVSWDHYKHELAVQNVEPEHIKRDRELRESLEKGAPPARPGRTRLAAIVAPDDPGADLYQVSTCISCHGTDLVASGPFPNLRGIGDRYDKEGIMGIIKEGKGVMSAQYDDLIKGGMNDAQINQLAEWLALQKAAQ